VRDARADALLVIGSSSRDPDLLPFTGSARLDDCFVVVRADGAHWLGYHSPIEREEAASTGVALLDPSMLEASAPIRGGDRPGARLARSVGIALRRTKVAGRRIALAGRYPNGELAQAMARLRREGYGFESGHAAMLRLRRTKSPAELDEMREVAAVTCDAIRRVAAILAAAGPGDPSRRRAGSAGNRKSGKGRAGRTQGGELAWRGEPLTVGVLRREVAATFAAAGLDEPEGNLIAPGREGAVPHNTGHPGTVLRCGESLIVDLFPRRRLHADCTRTFCVGAPAAELRAAHEAVLAALALAGELARPGARGFSIQQEVCRAFEARGHATVLSDRATTTGYVHGLGHGVGFEVHELPHFRSGGVPDEGTLERYDVFTLEPGLYDPGAGHAVRLEDLCRLGPEGLERLTPLPYDLDPRAWQGRSPGRGAGPASSLPWRSAPRDDAG
jgi:Xaa-Pro aminopeptidase